MTSLTTNSTVPTILPNNVQPIAYKVEFNVDLDQCEYSFKVDLHLKIKPQEHNDNNTIRLHWIPKKDRHPITSATFVQDNTTTMTSTTVTLEPDTQTILFTFDKSLSSGNLHLQGTSTLDDSLCGLYRSAYKDPHTQENKYMAVTQFEATDARRCFPCIDEPNAKATFELSVVVNRKYDVVSNMPLKERRSIDVDTVHIFFPPSPIMSTYLVALIVGEFDVISTLSSNGVRTSIYTPRGSSHLGQHALKVASKALPFFENQFGIKYPLPKSDLLAIPDFAAGAMENWGAVTYRESRLLIDPTRTSLSLTTRCTRTVCHELAHMWFGNYVTMKWWTQLWLNEGFARFMEFKAVNDQFPEWNIWQQFLYSVQGLAFDRDGMRTTHPVEQEVRHPKEIDQMFDVISYAKGASVLRMLHEWLGESIFMQGVRNYLNKYQYDNAVTEDLWSAIDQVVNEKLKSDHKHYESNVNTINVNDLMQEWIQQPGFPVVTVERNTSEFCINNVEQNYAYYNFTQTRFQTVSNNATNNKTEETKQTREQTTEQTTETTNSTLWKIPLNIIAIDVSNGTNSDRIMEERHLFIQEKETKKCINLMLINSGRVGFFRVNYSLEILQEIAPHISTSLTAADRLGLISDVVALSAAGICPITNFTQLLPSYQQEEELSVLQEIRDGISSLLKIHSHNKTIKKYLHELALNIFKSKADVLGWIAKKNEPSTDAVKRAVVLGICVTAEDPSTIQECQKQFDLIEVDSFATKGTTLAPELLGLVCIACVRNDTTDATWKKLMLLHSVATLAAEKRTFQSALGCAKSSELMQQTLEWAVNSGMVRNQDIFVSVASVARTDSKRGEKERSVVWEWFTSSYGTLVDKKLANSLMNSILSSAVSFVRNETDKKVVEMWLKKVEASSDMLKTYEKCMEKVDGVIGRREREEDVLKELSK